MELQRCRRLRKLSSSNGQLIRLHVLNLEGCKSLEALPDTIISMFGLQRLHMEGCSSISKLPTNIRQMTGLTSLSIDLATMWQGAGVGQLLGLKYLTVIQCTDEVIAMVDGSGILRNLNRQLVQFRFFPLQVHYQAP